MIQQMTHTHAHNSLTKKVGDSGASQLREKSCTNQASLLIEFTLSDHRKRRKPIDF